jgi:hypothetical protein
MTAAHDDGPQDEPLPGDHGPAWFEIRIGTLLDDRWSTWFAGMRMTVLPGGITRIAGPVADQAALHGVLGQVRDLGLPLLLVRRIAPE